MPFFPSPILKSFVGFDDLFEELNKISDQKLSNYPAYDILKKSEVEYIINIALAGFKIENLEIILLNDLLVIRGNKVNNQNNDIIHKGIANRSFEQKFKLDQLIEVKNATFKDGILSIFLFKKLPQNKDPVFIKINPV